VLKATLIGNLGNDPDLRYSANGSPLLRFNVASNYRTRTPEGEYQDRTEWVRVTVTGNRAESLSQYLRKGMRVYIDGRLEARPWTDQQGQMRAGLEVLADEVQFMSSRQDDEQRGGSEGAPLSPSAPARPSPSGPAPSRSSQPAPPSRPDPVDEGDLEDLPF
jgi:single-strand DNA-binding protein